MRKCLLSIGLVLTASVAAASEVSFFELHSREAFLEGSLDGVSVDALGTLALADRVERLAELGEPFLFSAAEHPKGWVVGTGNSGRVLLVDRKGGVEVLFEAPEPEIFAVWADADGTVFAGSSPRGKVYRVADGQGEVWFDPGETYIWDLARAADGSLLVATGTTGKLYRVTDAGKGSVFFDSEDTHIRSIQPLPDGEVLAGTAGEGLILRIAGPGKARTLYDAVQPEVVALAVDGSTPGGFYAAVLASEASLTDMSGQRAQPSQQQSEEGEQAAAEGVTVTVTSEPAQSYTGSRPLGFQGPRSEVLRIAPEGLVESVWRFDNETVYSLGWFRDRLWVGTGLDGKLYSFRDRKMVLEKDVDERQVVAIVGDRPGPAFATTNAAAFHRVSGATERQGRYTSPALDAGQISRFGSLRWEGRPVRGGKVSFSARTGMSSEPDSTWSAWTEPVAGEETALGGLPAGRYVQWRADLSAGNGSSPRIARVTVSYRQLNLPPRIRSFSVLDPGEVLVPSNFNPTNQIFEPAHPNREGIFTTLGVPRDDTPRKSVWKYGYRTLRWDVSDPNGDDLRFALSFRRELEGDSGWLSAVDDLEEPFYSFDATVIPDGLYRFRLRVSDRASESPEAALVAEEVSEPVLIDHTPPRILAVRRQGDAYRVTVEDGASPLREAQVSVDAAGWQAAVVEDGLLDGRREILEAPAPAKAHMVLLRLVDAAFNSVTVDLMSDEK